MLDDIKSKWISYLAKKYFYINGKPLTNNDIYRIAVNTTRFI